MASRGSQRTTSFVFISGMLLLIAYFLINPDDSIRFDRDTWMRDVKRLRMAKYIIKEDLLKDKTLSEAVQMLGEPVGGSAAGSDTTLVYKLDHPAQLLLTFDRKKILKDAAISED